MVLRPVVIRGSAKVLVVPDTSYFDPKNHLPFALVALFIECFITLPTSFLLILAPCLSRKLNFVKLRLKPIVDEFQACYRPDCRWFAGFYFLARELMFLASIIPQHAQDLPQSKLGPTMPQCHHPANSHLLPTMQQKVVKYTRHHFANGHCTALCVYFCVCM